LLDAFTSSLKGVVPASGGGTTNFLRADGTWAAPSSSGLTIGTINSQTKSANGAVISGSSLVMQTVDASNPGLMTSAQKARLDSNYFITTPVTGVQNAFQVNDSTLRIKGLLAGQNISVTNKGDTLNEIAITGDIPYSNLVQGSALSVLGVSGNATADVASIAAGSDGQALRRSGTSIGFGAIDLANSNATTGISPSTRGGTGNGFFKVSGPATTERTVTFPNSDATVIASVSGDVDGGGSTISNFSAKYNTQTGTTYTLVSSDNGKIITISNASAITLTVPTGLPVGFNCTVVQLGAGAITFTASSTTINNRGSNTKTAGQYAVASIISYTTNTFVTGGDMVP
jgi:hypothetical protein